MRATDQAARWLAITWNELRLLAHDPLPLVLMFACPVAFIALAEPALALALNDNGINDSNGAQQAVPAVIVVFSFFLVGLAGLVFFRDHGWGTWTRLRASTASTAEILTGKIVPLLGVALLQVAFLFALGVAVFGLTVPGSALALALIAVLLVLCVVALGVAVLAIATTLQQVYIVATFCTLVVAGFGGALVPYWLLPSWTQHIAPAMPSYWAMQGFQSVLINGGGLASVQRPALTLLAFTAGFALVAAVLFRVEEPKQAWA